MVTRGIQATKAGADEAFVTGTFAGVAPVGQIDGRQIASGERGPMVERLQALYMGLLDEDTRQP